MKKLMIAASAALCATVGFGLESANVVGYSTLDVKADQFYMVGVQLADIALSDKADFNSLIATTCTPGTYGDGSDLTYNNAPMIQVLKADGKSYNYYYYLNDGDDGTMRYDLTGWCDDMGNIVSSASQLALSKGFWFKSATAGTLTCAGQVCQINSFEREIPAGQFEIVANPYPVALNLNVPTVDSIVPGTYGDGSDLTYNNAPMIQVLKADGKSYNYYYYLNDGDDGTMRYDLTGWCDDMGNLVTGNQVEVGAAFWIKSASAGTFTFGL